MGPSLRWDDGVARMTFDVSKAIDIEFWRKSVGVEPTKDCWQPLPDLKSGRSTGKRSSSRKHQQRNKARDYTSESIAAFYPFHICG